MSESPFCAHLRSKKFFFLKGPPLVSTDFLDASNHCWCAKTFVALGPDDQTAHPDECVAGRACFEARFRIQDAALARDSAPQE